MTAEGGRDVGDVPPSQAFRRVYGSFIQRSKTYH